MILVDTDVWIDFFAGIDPGAAAVDTLLQQRRAVLSAITVFELLCGATNPTQIQQLETLLRLVPPIDLTAEGARLAAHHYTELRRTGSPIGNQDLLLAGTALEYRLPILTRNQQHFGRIEDLEVLSPDQIEAGG